MNGEIGLQNILVLNGTYNAHVSGRVYYNAVDQSATLPLAVVQEDSIDTNQTQDGVSTLNFNYVFVTHMASTKKKASQMAIDARTAVERNSGSYNSVIVESARFQTQRSGTEQLVDRKVFTVEQLYMLMIRPIQTGSFDYFLDFFIE
jgi:hypothetical protein